MVAVSDEAFVVSI